MRFYPSSQTTAGLNTAITEPGTPNRRSRGPEITAQQTTLFMLGAGDVTHSNNFTISLHQSQHMLRTPALGLCQFVCLALYRPACFPTSGISSQMNILTPIQHHSEIIEKNIPAGNSASQWIQQSRHASVWRHGIQPGYHYRTGNDAPKSVSAG